MKTAIQFAQAFLAFILLTALPTGSLFAQGSEDVYFSIRQDGLEIRGTVTVAYEPVFFGYPYLKLQYRNLNISSVSTGAGESFQIITDVPQLNTSSASISVRVPVRTPQPLGDRLSFTYALLFVFYSDIYPISDTYENDEVDAHFREVNNPNFSDSQIWEASEVARGGDRIEVTALSGTLIRQLQNLLEGVAREEGVREALNRYCGGVNNDEASVRQAMRAVGQAMSNARTDSERRRLEECQQRLSDQLSAIFEQAAADSERNRRNQNPYYYAMQDAEAAERRGDYAAALEFYRRAYAYQPSPQLADKIQALETTVQAVAAAAGAAVVIDGLTNELRSGSTRLMRGALLMQLVYSGTDFSPSVGLGSGVTFDDIDGGYFSLERIVWFNPASTSGLNIGASAHFSESLSNKQLSRGSLDVSSHYVNAHLNLHMLGFLELGPTFRYLKMEGSYEQNSTGREIGYGGDWQPAMGLRGAMYLKRQAEFFIRGIGWYVDTRPDSDYTIPGLFNSADRHMLSYGYRLELVWQPWSVSFYSSTDSYYNNVDNLHFGRNQWGVSLGFGFGF